MIREYALEQVWRNQSNQTSEADALKELGETFSAAARWGITTIQDMDNDMPPDRCIALLGEIPVPIRVRIIRMPEQLLPAATFRKLGQFHAPRIRS